MIRCTVCLIFKMDIISVVGISICALILIVSIKDTNSQYTVLIAIAASVIILLYVITQLSVVTNFIDDLAVRAGIDNQYFEIILKALGICYLCEFGSSLCRDAGQNSLATKMELACKCSVLVISLPLFSDILELIAKLW